MEESAWRIREVLVKAGGFLAVLVWCLWLIPTPVYEQVKDNTSVSVYAEHPVSQVLPISIRIVDGIDIQVENANQLPNTTMLTLVISREDGSVIRIIDSKLGDVLSSDKLRFRFASISLDPAQPAAITLTASSLLEKHPLFIRYFNDTHELSYRVLAPRPQIISFIEQILHINTVGTDIALTYDAGSDIIHGKNPYDRILSGNLQDNSSYATYLPSFYLVSALSQWAGLDTYSSWIAFWRPVFLLFALATAGLLFSVFWKRGWYVLAFFGALFFLLNRWSLYIATVGLFDFIPIFFLVLSLLLLKKRPYLSLFLFGLSLSFRHISAILLPLYVIALWQATSSKDRIKKTFLGALSLILIPLAVSIPFMVANITSFLKSMAFSFTRGPVTHFSVPSVDAFLGLVGPSSKVELLVLLGLVYVVYARKYVGFFTASLLAFLVFLNFHSVWFAQYMAYAAPIGVVALLEIEGRKRE
ncbi:MAG: hypothetical protein K8Q97_01685 [Candidatus Andersenbacteria bacterium]|nr:hypothetical protein [Candidatus Andersenbacteria bacterium]